MFDGGSAPYAVVYSDGGREMNVGTVVVDHKLTFKSLLSQISHRIGMPPHQFSVFLAALGTDRKIPITAKVNLAAMPRGGAAHFFLVKRTTKRHKNPPPHGDKIAPPQNAMLLRRAAAEPPVPALSPPVMDRLEYEMRMRNLMMERERFLMNMAVNDASVGRGTSHGVAVAGERNGGGAVCGECSRAKELGIDVGFHLCVYDEVTVGFRSPAGPISRPPANNSGEH